MIYEKWSGGLLRPQLVSRGIREATKNIVFLGGKEETQTEVEVNKRFIK
jgi:hypothetical protein